MLRQRQAGFTLIEIMIAVAILSIIAAIAIPAYRGYIQESRYGAALQDMRQMQLILDDLALDGDLDSIEPGSYTGTVLKVFSTPNGIEAAGSASGDQTSWLDPWGQEYRYQRPAAAWCAPANYCLWSFGPDAADDSGGDDDAVVE